MILTKTTLISIDLIQNNFRTEQVNKKVIEWPNVFEKSRGTSWSNCVRFHCVCVICFDAFYIIWASDDISQDFYPNRKISAQWKAKSHCVENFVTIIAKTLLFFLFFSPPKWQI